MLLASGDFSHKKQFRRFKIQDVVLGRCGVESEVRLTIGTSIVAVELIRSSDLIWIYTEYWALIDGK